MLDGDQLASINVSRMESLDAAHGIQALSLNSWCEAFSAAERAISEDRQYEIDYYNDDFERIEDDQNQDQEVFHSQSKSQSPIKTVSMFSPKATSPSDIDSLEHFAINLYKELDILEPESRITFQESPGNHPIRPTCLIGNPASPKKAPDFPNRTSIKGSTTAQIVDTYCIKSDRVYQDRWMDLAKPKTPLSLKFKDSTKNRQKRNHPPLNEQLLVERKVDHTPDVSPKPPWVEITHKDYSYMSPRFSPLLAGKIQSNQTQFVNDADPLPQPRPPPSSSKPSNQRGGRSIINNQNTISSSSGDNNKISRDFTQRAKYSPSEEKNSKNASPPKHHSPGPNDGVLASKPLQWSRQFGDEGRRASSKKEQSKPNIKPPPTLSEDLIEILSPMITTIIREFFTNAIQSTDYCNGYSDALQQLFHGNTSSTAVEEEVKCNVQSLQLILNAINEIHSGRSVNIVNKDSNHFSFLRMLEMFDSIPNRRPFDEISICLIWLLRCDADVSSFLSGECVSATTEVFSSFMQTVRESAVEGSDWQADRGINKIKMDRKELRLIVDQLRNLHVFEMQEYELDGKLIDASRIQPSITSNSVHGNSIYSSHIQHSTHMNTVTNTAQDAFQVGRLNAQSVIMKQVMPLDETKLNTLFNTNINQPQIHVGSILPNKPTSAGKVRPLGEGKVAVTHLEPSGRKRLHLQQQTDVKNILNLNYDGKPMVALAEKLQPTTPVCNQNRDQQVYERIQNSEKFIASMQSVRKTPVATFVPVENGKKIQVLCGSHLGIVAFRKIFPSIFSNRSQRFTTQHDKFYQRHNYVIDEVLSSPAVSTDDDQERRLHNKQRTGNEGHSAAPVEIDQFDLQDEGGGLAEEPFNASIGIFQDCSDDSEQDATLDRLGPMRPLLSETESTVHQIEHNSHYVFLSSAPKLTDDQKCLLFCSLLSDVIRSFVVRHFRNYSRYYYYFLFAASSNCGCSACIGRERSESRRP